MNRGIESAIAEKTKILFSMLFGLDIAENPPYQLQIPDTNHWDISTMVGITGECYGIMAIRLNYDLCGLLMEHSRVRTPENTRNQQLMTDMVGEIINIISGNVLSEMSEKDFRLSIPVTIQGEGHEISWPKNTAVTAIPFEFSSYRMEIQAGIVSGPCAEK